MANAAVRWAALLALLLLSLFMLAMSVRGAPAPLPRRQPVELPMVGEWDMKFGACDYVATFDSGGHYTATPGGWVGDYYVARDWVTVREWQARSSPDCCLIWRVRLSRIPPHRGDLEFLSPDRRAFGKSSLEITFTRR